MDKPRNFFSLLNITGKSKISSDYTIEHDMGSRITDQKQVAQLFNEKLVSIGTDTLKQYTNDGLEYVPEIESNIKTSFLYPLVELSYWYTT